MKDKNHSFYKYSTYVLLAVIVIAGLVYLVNNYNDGIYNRGVADGQAQAVNFLLSSVINTGSAEIGVDENTSVILVPLQTVEAAQVQVLTTVAQSAITEGFVSLTFGNDTLILVPVDPSQIVPAENN